MPIVGLSKATSGFAVTQVMFQSNVITSEEHNLIENKRRQQTDTKLDFDTAMSCQFQFCEGLSMLSPRKVQRVPTHTRVSNLRLSRYRRFTQTIKSGLFKAETSSNRPCTENGSVKRRNQIKCLSDCQEYTCSSGVFRQFLFPKRIFFV